MSQVETESGFLVGGRIYPIPTLETFNMQEARVLYDYSGLTLEDFVPPDPDVDDVEEKAAELAVKTKNPAFLMALLHIALQRGNQDWKPEKVKKLTEQSNLIATVEGLVDEEDAKDDTPPPTVAPDSLRMNEQLGSSPRSSEDSNGNSGLDSKQGSVELATTPELTGTGELPTLHTSDPMEWDG